MARRVLTIGREGKCSIPLLAALLVLLFPFCNRAQETPAHPQAKSSHVKHYKPQGYVNDYLGILDSETKAQLTSLSQSLDQEKQTQIAFVTISSTHGVPIKEFATQLFNRWGIGHKDTNRGVLVLFAIKDRHYRISVSRGLESILTDDECARLGHEMEPLLKQREYGEAFLQIGKQLQQEIQEKVK